MNKPMRRKGKIIIDLDKKTGSKVLNFFQKEGGKKEAYKKAKEYLYNLAKRLGGKYKLEPVGFWFDQNVNKFTFDMKKISKDKVDVNFAEPGEVATPTIPTPETIDTKRKTKKPEEKVDLEKSRIKKDIDKKLNPQEALDMISDIVSRVKKISEPKAARLRMACKRAKGMVRRLTAVFNVIDDLDPEEAINVLRGARVKALISHVASDNKRGVVSKGFAKQIQLTDEGEDTGVEKTEANDNENIAVKIEKKAEYNPVIDTDVKAKPPYKGEVVKAQEGGDNKQEALVNAQENVKDPSVSKKPEMALTEQTPAGAKKGTKEIVAELIENMEAKGLIGSEESLKEKKTLTSMNTRQLNMLKKEVDKFKDTDGNASLVRDGQFINLKSIL